MMKYVEKSSTDTHSVGYTYDSLNNLTALAETFGTTERKFSYAYDGDNRPTSITAGNSFLGYAYDAYGRVSTLTTKHDGNTFATKTYAYKVNANGTPTSQVSDVTIEIAGNSQTYTYTYDKNCNITSISDGTYTTDYAYDSANQLIREDNQEAETTTVWTYDNAGNILTRTVYPYTTEAVGTGTQTEYTYDDSQWGDLLTEYNGNTITHDNIGNPLNDGTWSYTWQHGRQLASMSKLDQSEAWQFTYNADGLRTQRKNTNSNTTYNYTYLGSQLTHMTVAGDTMYFAYDASGVPLSMTYNGVNYYYVTNLQGDVVAILNASGAEVVRYAYDAWGNLISTTGTLANPVGSRNPLRYRGYVYDAETGLYYLQSRYYDPEIGRFINADSLLNQGTILGSNMFAYCLNNPVGMADTTGNLPFLVVTAAVGAVFGAVVGGISAAKNGGNVWAGIGIGAAVGGLVGAGFGAAAGVALAGMATASTAAVVMGGATLCMTTAAGGLGAGIAYIANNVLGNPTYTDPVLFSGGDAALKAAENYTATSGGTIIGDTIIGKTADSLSSHLPSVFSDFIWKGASELFCQQSTGSAYALISNGSFEVSTSMFWNYEMPILLNKVREIIIEIF